MKQFEIVITRYRLVTEMAVLRVKAASREAALDGIKRTEDKIKYRKVDEEITDISYDDLDFVLGREKESI